MFIHLNKKIVQRSLLTRHFAWMASDINKWKTEASIHGLTWIVLSKSVEEVSPRCRIKEVVIFLYPVAAFVQLVCSRYFCREQVLIASMVCKGVVLHFCNPHKVWRSMKEHPHGAPALRIKTPNRHLLFSTSHREWKGQDSR